MRYDLIIKNGTVVTAEKSVRCDIAAADGKIVKVGDLGSDTAAEIYDAEGLYVLPGIIDAHVHFRDPGLTEKEDFETGSLAAAMGGVTLIADMPNVIPVTSTVENLNEKIKIAKEKSYVDFALFALLNSDNLDEMEGLKNAGALGFKVFFGTSTGDIAAPSLDVLVKQMEKCAELGLRIGFHAESNEINANFTSIAKKETDTPDGFWFDYARPVLSEIHAIKSITSLAYGRNTKIHIHHITSEDGAALIAEAKEKEMDISAETCPHYLVFNCEEDTHKVLPPIRDSSHQDALWENIREGVIDMIASDHAPHKESEKELTGWEAPAGLCGIETFVNLLLNEVNKGKISINDYVRLSSTLPAKIWGIYPCKGSLEPGSDADITIVNLNKKKVIRVSELHSKSKTSPYDGMEVQGEAVATIIRGVFVMRDGKLLGKKGYGELVKPLN